MGRNIGKFKYVCSDCGTVRLLLRGELDRKTRKVYCKNCGGSFWLPASTNAMVDFHRASVARKASSDSKNTPATHRAVLPQGHVMAYRGSKLVDAESKGRVKTTKYAVALDKNERPSPATDPDRLAAPPLQPREREPTAYTPKVKPLGKARKKENAV